MGSGVSRGFQEVILVHGVLNPFLTVSSSPLAVIQNPLFPSILPYYPSITALPILLENYSDRTVEVHTAKSRT